LLREHTEAVEADLSRYYSLDLRDLWRFDSNGSRKLTYRMIQSRIRHLPFDAATTLALGGTGWGLEHHLAADIFHAFAGIPHPGLPKQVKTEDPIRKRKIAEAKERMRLREIELAKEKDI
jgi:hypothetical protein